MKRRFLLPLMAVVAMTFAVCASTAEAGRYYRTRVYRPVVRKPMVKSSNAYMVRRADCKTLFDLGKQNGAWPRLP